MARITRIEKAHDVAAETYRCEECTDLFPFVGYPDLCPNCGVEFESTADVTEAAIRRAGEKE